VCRPEIAYERTKLEGERAVLAAAGEHRMPVVSLRPVWVYGPGCERTAKLFRAIGRGRFFVAGSGRGLRHCIHIDDMITAFLLAARSEAAVGHTIIIGDERPVTIRELVDRIAVLTGARRPVRVPRWAVLAAATVAESIGAIAGFEPPLSRRTLRFFDANTAFRTDRARRLLGFRPEHDLESGLAATWEILGPSRESSRRGPRAGGGRLREDPSGGSS
jgi:nucleoside-diphosphate-sugar epimerase